MQNLDKMRLGTVVTLGTLPKPAPRGRKTKAHANPFRVIPFTFASKHFKADQAKSRKSCPFIPTPARSHHFPGQLPLR